MKASVVIPTYNRRNLVERTLRTVFDQNFQKTEYEVIVVVDGSTDGTAEFLKTLTPPCRFQILIQANKGQAAAKNAGAKVAKGKILLFLDDDLLCDRQLLKEHIRGHEGKKPVLVGGPVLMAPDSPRCLSTIWVRQEAENEVNRCLRTSNPNWPEDMLMGQNTSIPREVFLSSGGFDETFRVTHDDSDLSMRLWENFGIAIHFQPAAVAFQYYTKTTGDWVRDALWYGRNEVLFGRKHSAYRPFSSLARLETGSWLKRSLRRAVTCLPISVDAALALPCSILENLSSAEAQKIGMRVLGVRRSIAQFRGALRETGSWRALRREFGVRLPVLSYHHIGPRVAGYHCKWTVYPHEFARHVRWLARRGYVGISPSVWFAWVREGKALPDKPVLLTFDGAYADLATYAFPILREYEFSAGVFVVTGCIGDTKAFPEVTSTQTHAMMNAEQIRKSASHGIEFGAYGHTHQDLTILSRSDIAEEIGQSRAKLADILQDHVAAFAYPFGRYNDAVRELVRSQFDMAFTVEEGLNALPTSLDLLQRIAVKPGDSLFDLACRVQLGWHPIRNLTARIHARSRIRRAVQELCDSK